MASVIDNNIVMWDVGDNGVKIVCTAVLDGKGKELSILFGLLNTKKTMIFIIFIYFVYILFCMILISFDFNNNF